MIHARLGRLGPLRIAQLGPGDQFVTGLHHAFDRQGLALGRVQPVNHAQPLAHRMGTDPAFGGDLLEGQPRLAQAPPGPVLQQGFP